MKMNKRILRSALAVFAMCGAFSMTAVSVSAEETERLPETTTVVTSDVIDVDNLPVISVTTPDENENDGKYTIDINDIPDIEGVDKSDIIAAVGGLPAGNGTSLKMYQVMSLTVSSLPFRARTAIRSISLSTRTTRAMRTYIL